MKHLFQLLLIATIFTLNSCATNPKDLSKSFDLDTGKEIRAEHPFHSGKSDCKIVNQTDTPINIITGDTDTIVWSNSILKIEVTAKDSLVVDGVLMDYELLGRQKYKWIYSD